MKKTAFTLAEVLITLGIIGVVAALTIPALISNYQKQAYVNQLKATYSILANGFSLIQREDNVSTIEDTSFYAAFGLDDTATAITELKKSFKVIFACKDGENECDVGAPYAKFGGGPYFWGHSGTPSPITFGLPNGALVYLYYGSDGNPLQSMGIVVDINGSKKTPNVYGRDVFRLTYESSRLAAWKTDSDNDWETGADGDPCNEGVGNGSGIGWCCAQRIIQKGWIMDY